jgi:hypothetical protein
MPRPRLRRNPGLQFLVRRQHMHPWPILRRLRLRREQFQQRQVLLHRPPPRLLRGQRHRRRPQRCQVLWQSSQWHPRLFPRLLRLQDPRPRTRTGLPLLRDNRRQRVQHPVERHRQDVHLCPARNPWPRARRPQLLVVLHAHKFLPVPRCPPATAGQFPARCRAAASARVGRDPDSPCVRNSRDRVDGPIPRAPVAQVGRAELAVHLGRDRARHRRDRVPAHDRPAGQGCCRHFQRRCR